jgi:hypothetical protein
MILPDPSEVKIAEPVTDNEAQSALAVAVTVHPPSINTSSPATGAEKPGAPPETSDQVAVAFQLPVATEYLLAAFRPMLIMHANVTKTKVFLLTKAFLLVSVIARSELLRSRPKTECKMFFINSGVLIVKEVD